jgi:hypothetical protein
MILKCDKVIKLRLETFRSSNLSNFHLEQSKSNQNVIVHERNKEKNYHGSVQLNRAERAKISISTMPELLSVVAPPFDHE